MYGCGGSKFTHTRNILTAQVLRNRMVAKLSIHMNPPSHHDVAAGSVHDLARAVRPDMTSIFLLAGRCLLQIMLKGSFGFQCWPRMQCAAALDTLHHTSFTTCMSRMLILRVGWARFGYVAAGCLCVSGEHISSRCDSAQRSWLIQAHVHLTRLAEVWGPAVCNAASSCDLGTVKHVACAG